MRVSRVIQHAEPEPTEADRFGLYVWDPRRRELRRVAECERDAIGAALTTLAADRREAGGSGTEIIGVLDRIDRRWLCGVWKGGP